MRKCANNFTYYLTVNDRKVSVCKTFFLNTLVVSERYAYTAWDKLDEPGIVGADNRCKHSNHRKTDEVILEGIRNHIKSFLVIESHYLRTQTRTFYLDGSLSISQLFRLHKEKCSTANEHSKYSQIRLCDFDLQSVLQTPYYELSRKLNVYNLTMHQRMVIVTFGMRYLETKEQQKLHHVDNFCAQNNNKFLATMYLFATQAFQKVESITHKYVVVGYTQNAGESMNSSSLFTFLHSGPELCSVPKETGTPYYGRKMNFTEFHVFKTLSAEIGSNFTVDENGNVVT
ncbi:hypothetical protein PR048_005548 [Dryococelus australis]|uniref:Uncharacterized protein n=1 Tax=Dryococelus australis TaxID=614101 RepID=A0ABQ9I8G1_9NEOP|nr:hypothetical protein PR048_005548 [Dryococelus australis]